MGSKHILENLQQTEGSFEHEDGASAISHKLHKITKELDTIADLIAMTEKPSTVYVTGYHTAGDGAFGSHLFKRVDSPATDNGVDIRVPTAGIGSYHYKLQHNGVIYAKWAETVQKALDIGGDIDFSGYTLDVDFTTTFTPIFTVNSDTKLIFNRDTVFNISADNTPTTTTEEYGRYIFDCSNTSNVEFCGDETTINFQKDAAIDPRCGFIKGEQAEKIKVHGFQLNDSSIQASGLVHFDSWNGISNSRVFDIEIYKNKINRCSNFILIKNIWSNINIHDNIGYHFDLSNANTGYSQYGTTIFGGRAIRLTGYTANSSSADGNIFNLKIKDNFLFNATYGIEVWNQDTTNGQNPDNAYDIEISGNRVRALFGIGSNSFSDFKIHNNTVNYCAFNATQMLSYAGTSYLTDTSATYNTAGAGIEARPGYAGKVYSNNVDLGYTTTGTDYTASSQCIAIGSSNKNIRCEVEVFSNNLTNGYNCLSIGNTQKSKVYNNKLSDGYRLIDGTFGTNSFGYSGNEMYDNTFTLLDKTSNNQVAMTLYGDWLVKSNIFAGFASDRTTVALVKLGNTTYTTGKFEVENNKFNDFLGEAILDYSIESSYKSNQYNATTTGLATRSTYGAVTFIRQTDKKCYISSADIENCSSAYAWAGTAGTGETYTANEVNLVNVLNAHKDKGGGIYDMFFNAGYISTVPATGYWSAGIRHYDETPSAGGHIGWVCTTSGTPGTWKTFGSIAV